jgi:EspA/EspE family
VSALDGFYSTWSKARDTFGVGTPTDGSQHDGSSHLLRMKTTIESAAPDDRWQGSGSQAYAAANKEHASVYQKLAELDKKMAGEVTNAANVVASGRTKLDGAKNWVGSMVDSLPPSSAQVRETSLIPIANEGITRVNSIVQDANKDMFAIGLRVTGLKGEFDTLSNTMKFGPGTEKLPADQNSPPAPDVRLPGRPWDPANPQYGNSAYGQWETISTSPTGPWPPLDLKYRSFEDSPLKIGPTTGLYVPKQSWITNEDAPLVQFREGYQFRLAGTQPTDVTRLVNQDGQWQVQRWVSNVYEYQRNTSKSAGGDFAGLPPIQNIDREWKPISIPEINTLSASNSTVKYYLPDGCGGSVTMQGGVPTNMPRVDPPIMTRPRG